jgi:cbb3-type cytochrome oxidase maturation protein
MNVILILIPVSLAFAGAFLLAFIWSVRNGQFEDTDTPAMRILGEDDAVRAPLSNLSEPETENLK